MGKNINESDEDIIYKVETNNPQVWANLTIDKILDGRLVGQTYWTIISNPVDNKTSQHCHVKLSYTDEYVIAECNNRISKIIK